MAVPTQWVAPGVLACVAPSRAAAGTVALVLATPHTAAAPGGAAPQLFAPLCAPVPFSYRDAAAPGSLFSPYGGFSAAAALPDAAAMHHAAHAA